MDLRLGGQEPTSPSAVYILVLWISITIEDLDVHVHAEESEPSRWQELAGNLRENLMERYEH